MKEKHFLEIIQRIEDRKEKRLLRSFRHQGVISIDPTGKEYLNFCSNNYLGLAQHSALIDASIQFTKDYGVGSTASRLVCGQFSFYQTVEARFALWARRERALILNSGYQTNVSLLPALLGPKGFLFLDQECHNSLVQGALASRATLYRYAHQNLKQLEHFLCQTKHQNGPKAIVTESLFSMSGDRTDLTALSQLANRFNCLLIVDDAHAIGVLGDEGSGLAAHHPGVDIVIGGFGKAFGVFGGYILSSSLLHEYLVQKCSGMIYSTALPPGVLGALSAALDIVPTLDEERKQLANRAFILRRELQRMGFETGCASDQIIPVAMPNSDVALKASQKLQEMGILAVAIRPPTVSQACLRLSLSVLHTDAHCERLLEGFKCLDL